MLVVLGGEPAVDVGEAGADAVLVMLEGLQVDGVGGGEGDCQRRRFSPVGGRRRPNLGPIRYERWKYPGLTDRGTSILTSVAFACYHGGLRQGREGLVGNALGGLWFALLYAWTAHLAVVTAAHGLAIALIQIAAERGSTGGDDVEGGRHSTAVGVENAGDVPAARGDRRE